MQAAEVPMVFRGVGGSTCHPMSGKAAGSSRPSILLPITLIAWSVSMLVYQNSIHSEETCIRRQEVQQLRERRSWPSLRCAKEVAEGCIPEQNCPPFTILASAEAVDPAITDVFGLEVKLNAAQHKARGKLRSRLTKR
ncbi:hypothetical protein THAOC_10828 [Thalassiosira oceanica]|uniref:Uncharacterized protein n=1 Tax=Thalassiosira oceanica TaxID=159749 RepID=K0SRL5_THAOC|nr:hypothetical protein THAOC_10828 [Thalassiosira oceanica]|eukprot:EJK68040.1 hypothetical protein THAOC_10828 [Thalassiosira oceanica]